MATRKELVKNFVEEAVEGFKIDLAELTPTPDEIALERKGGCLAAAEYEKRKAFTDEYGLGAYHALYAKPYTIGRGLSGLGLKEVQLRNVETGLIMAAAGTEAIAVARFKKLAQKRRVGAPAKMEDGKRTNVYLNAKSRAIAERIGGGNVSEGIRKALDAMPQEIRPQSQVPDTP